MAPDISGRVHFKPETGVMELSFEGIQLKSADEVNAVYDQLEQLIARSGREKWYLFVNESNFSLYPEAWVAHANRGRKLREARTIAILRYGMLDKPVDQRYVTRAEAITELSRLLDEERRKAEAEARRACRYSKEDLAARICLERDAQILHLDLKDFEFGTTGDVDGLFDALEHETWKTAAKWYLLINFEGCRILPDAWTRYAQQSRRFAGRHTLGSVRYDTALARNTPQPVDEEDQDPNFCASEADARARIDALKAGKAQPVLRRPRGAPAETAELQVS